MFMRILTSALYAGFAAGLIAALLQLVFVQPVLLHAELYESGELVHFGEETGDAAALLAASGIDLVRDGLSVLFSALIYTGYAFLLVAVMALSEERGAVISARTGLVWGVAGFIAFHMAPAFSLPPELPGLAAADVSARQIWWWSTAAATGAGLWLIAFANNWTARIGAIALLLAPHLVGAPQPDGFTGPVPPELGVLFAARALGTGLAAWAILGLFAGWFWQREGAAQGDLKPA